MRTIARLFALACVAAILTPAFMLWDATGRRTFTKMPSPGYAELQKQEGSLSGLFGEEPKAQPPIDNEFRLGLLPSGWGGEAMSVVSVGGPAILVGLLALCRGGSGKCCSRKNAFVPAHS
jgi:hypothetical protein